jgi:hypothetical protein
MNGFKQFLLSHVCFATDDSAAGGAPADPGPVDNTPQIETTAAPEPEATAPEQAAEAEPEPEPEQPKPDRDTKRWGELVRKLGDESRKREAAERRLQEIEAARQQPEPEQPQDGERRYTQAELNALAEQKAQQLAARQEAQREQQAMQAKLATIGQVGSKEFTEPAWNDACNTLADLGADRVPAFMPIIAELENGHAVLHTLGNDPVLAARVLSMKPALMGVELGRLSAAAAAPKPAPAPKAVSRAPEPIAPVGGRGTVAKTNPDDMSMDEYVKYRGYQKGAVGARR